MGTNSEVTFALFMVFNSMDFSMSLSMINILTSKFPLQFELQICLVALFFTYNTAMTCIAPSSIRDFTIIMKSVLSSIILTLTSAEKYCLGNYPQSSAWPAPSTHLSTLQTRAELVENLKTTQKERQRLMQMTSVTILEDHICKHISFGHTSYRGYFSYISFRYQIASFGYMTVYVTFICMVVCIPFTYMNSV